MQCNTELKESIRANLARFDRKRAAEGSRAAVAVTVLEVGPGADLPGIEDPGEWSREPALLLTRRSQALRNHPGQWALPGGRVDDGENATEAALRELHEEVAIDLAEDNVLGYLDDFVTRSGFIMTPVVVWAGRDMHPVPNPDEVASVHRIPIAEFMRDDAPVLLDNDTSDHPILKMPVGTDWIAAPTAAILYQFREVCVHGEDTRVAHFEQPEFAWR